MPIRRLLGPLLAVLVLAGCSGAATDQPAADQPAAAPAVQVPAPQQPAQPVDTSCDPTASLRPSGPTPAAMPAGSYMQAIRDRGQLIVGTTQDTLLFSSLNPATNTIEGFDVDMAALVAKAIFGTADGRLRLVVVPSAGREAAVQSGAVDLVAETMTINCARWRNVDFSTVYLDAGQRLLVPTTSTASTMADLQGQRVCAVPNSTSVRAIEAAEPGPELVTASTWGGCLVAFQQNEADAISTDDTILAGLAAQDPYAKVVGPRITDEPYGMAMGKTHPEFTRFVNGVLDDARTDGTWKAIYDRWLTRLGAAPEPPPARYRD